MYLCVSSSENGFTFAALRGQAGEVEEGNTIYCCVLGKQHSPWGISTDVTWEFANVLSDFGFENKISTKDAKDRCSGCQHRCFWILLWISVLGGGWIWEGRSPHLSVSCGWNVPNIIFSVCVVWWYKLAFPPAVPLSAELLRLVV